MNTFFVYWRKLEIIFIVNNEERIFVIPGAEILSNEVAGKTLVL